MFVSDKIVFLEMQKTGGSHILRLLNTLVNGEIIGKHNRIIEEYRDRFVFGSIRNPWDWYVSLWAYGVGGKGAIRKRTTTGVDLNYYNSELPKYLGKNWLSPVQMLIQTFYDFIKPTDSWRSTYLDSANPEQFRQWISMLLDHKHRYDIGEGYAFSPLSKHAGLMTYRYLRLFTAGNSLYTDKHLGSYSGTQSFDSKHNFSQGMIRTENLEEDFIQIIQRSGIQMSSQQTEEIKNAAKTNTSRRKEVTYYYDEKTIALVAEKERFIIEKYAFVPPPL